MPNDPLKEVADIKAAYEALSVKAQAAIDALAAAQAANPASNFVTPDVQAALDALDAEVQSPTKAS